MTTDTHTPALSSVRATRTAVIQGAEEIIATLMGGLSALESAAISLDRGDTVAAGEDVAGLQRIIDRQRAELAEVAGHVCPTPATEGFELPGNDQVVEEAHRENHELTSELGLAGQTITRLTAELESALSSSRAGDSAVAELQGQVRELKARLAAAAAVEPEPETTVEDARADAMRIIEALAADNPELQLSEALELVHIAYAGGKAPEPGPDAATNAQKPLDGIPATESAADASEGHTAPQAAEDPIAQDPAPTSADGQKPIVQAAPLEEDDEITDAGFFDSPPAWEEEAAGKPAEGDVEFKFDDAEPSTRVN